jgi:hypothetical protein
VTGTWRGNPLLRTLENVYRKALETGFSLHRGPARKPGRGIVYWGICKKKPGSRTGQLSPRELYDGNLEGASLMGTPKDMLSKTLEMGACFHRGPAFGKHGGMHLSYGL